jgi:hypothetical protein
MLMWIGLSELAELKLELELELELELDVHLHMVDLGLRYSEGSIFVSCCVWTVWFTRVGEELKW